MYGVQKFYLTCNVKTKINPISMKSQSNETLEFIANKVTMLKQTEVFTRCNSIFCMVPFPFIIQKDIHI